MASRRKASKRNVGTRILDIDSRLKRAERKFSPETLGSSVVSSVNIVAGSVTPDSLDSALSGSLLDAISGATEIGNSAESAYITAEQAANAAANAQLSADGKNTIYYQAAAPTGGTYRTNDIWFDTDDGYKMYVWNGTAWTASVFGNSALGTLDVGKLTAGTVNASMQMTVGTVANGTSRVVIDGGGSGDAGIRLISRSAGGVDTTLVNLSATTGSATFTGSITAASGNIGGFTIGASSLSATNILLDNAAPTLRLGPSGAGSASVFYASSSNGLWLGHHTSTSAPFRVTLAGALTASNATVTGTINATAGYIGSTASNGWTINSDFLRSQGAKQITLDGTNARMYIAAGTGTHATAGTDFYADANGLFSLRDKLIFNPGTTDTSGFATLTVIGRIRGAIDNVPIVLPDSGQFTVSQAVISGTSPNQTAVVTTSLTHNFAVNDTVIIEKVTGGASVINGAWKITAKTSTSFTITGIAGATNNTYTGLAASGSIARVRELTLGLHPALNGSPAGLGIRLDEYNYWFVNNAMRFGNAQTWVKWDGTTLDVLGKIRAIEGYIGTTTGTDGWTISANTLSNSAIGLYAPTSTTTSTTTSGSTSSGSTSIVVTSASGILVGQTVTHSSTAPLIPGGTVVTSVVGTTIGISSATTGVIASGQTLLFAEIGFYSGNATRQSAPFWVDYRGNLFSNNATITGTLTATSGNLGAFRVSGTPTSAVTRSIADPRFSTLSGAFLENKTNPNDTSTSESYVSLFTGTLNASLSGGLKRADGLIVHRPDGTPFYSAYLGTYGLLLTSPDNVNLVKNGGFENFQTPAANLTSWATTDVVVGSGSTQYASVLTGFNLFTSTSPRYLVTSGQFGGRITWGSTSSNPSGYLSATIDGSALNKYYSLNPPLKLFFDLFYSFNLTPKTLSSVTVTDTTMTVVTSTAHGFVTGDIVSFAAVIMDDNGTDFAGAGAYVVTSVTNSTTFVVSNNVAIQQGVEVLGSVGIFPIDASSPSVAKMYPAYLDLNDVRIRFANGTTVSLYSALTSGDQASWSFIRYIPFADYYGWTVTGGLSVSPLQLLNPINISLTNLKAAAGANWNGSADFFIDFPAWLYRAVYDESDQTTVETGPYTATTATISTSTTGSVTLSSDPNSSITRYRIGDVIVVSGLTGNASVMNGVRTLTNVSGAVLSFGGFTGGTVGTYTGQAGTVVSKLTATSGVTYSYVLDSVGLGLSSTFIAGDFGTNYSWYSTAYASASIKTNSPYIDFTAGDGQNATSSISNLDKIYYQPIFTKPLAEDPWVGSDPLQFPWFYEDPEFVNPLAMNSGTFRYKVDASTTASLWSDSMVHTSSLGTGWEATSNITYDTGSEFRGVVGIGSKTTGSTFYVKANTYEFKSPSGTPNFISGYGYASTSGASSNTSSYLRIVQDSGAITRTYNNGTGSGGSIGYSFVSGARYVAFTAPASGCVLIHISGRLDNSLSTGRCYYSYELRTGSATGTIHTSVQFHNALYLIGTNATMFGKTTFHKLTPGTTYWFREQLDTYAAAGTTNVSTVDYRRIIIQPVN